MNFGRWKQCLNRPTRHNQAGGAVQTKLVEKGWFSLFYRSESFLELQHFLENNEPNRGSNLIEGFQFGVPIGQASLQRFDQRQKPRRLIRI